MRNPSIFLSACLLLCAASGSFCRATDLNADIGGLSFQRENTFEFTQAPSFKKAGPDRYEIAFAAKAHCDVAVAILDADGKLVRHLAGGVLGANAPEPFKKGSLEQALIWDGKNDAGRYIENAEACRARVSLGLKPEFDKVLYWSPNRLSWCTAGIVADQDGVYVINVENYTSTTGHQVADTTLINRYDHDGKYVKALLPLAHDKVDVTKFAPSPASWKEADGEGGGGNSVGESVDGPPFALTLLSGKTVISCTNEGSFFKGWEPNAFCAVDGRILGLVNQGPHGSDFQFYRLGTDGSRPAEGFYSKSLGSRKSQGPCWMAVSPDKKWIYLSGLCGRYHESYANQGSAGLYMPWSLMVSVKDKKEVAEHAIYRVPYDQSAGLSAPFAGKPGQPGAGADELSFPEGIACDSEGRVYVADFHNSRVQVFSTDGKLVKSIPAPEPMQVAVHPKTGAIYVLATVFKEKYFKLIKFNSLNDATAAAEQKFDSSKMQLAILPTFALDAWAAEPTIWITGSGCHVQMWADKGAKFELKRDLHDEAARDWKGYMPESLEPGDDAPLHLGAITADPFHPHVYLSHFRGAAGAHANGGKTVRINTDTGEVDLVPGHVTMFGADGYAYLRDGQVIMRYDPVSWKPVAFDYGEGDSGALHYRFCADDGNGMCVSPTGKMLFHDRWPPVPGMILDFHPMDLGALRIPSYMRVELWAGGSTSLMGYRMREFYPGRPYGVSGSVLMFDEGGQLRNNDVIGGAGRTTSGLRMDRQGNVYIGMPMPRLIDGKEMMGNALAKFGPKGGRIVVEGKGVKFPIKETPQRPPDFRPSVWDPVLHGVKQDTGPNGELGYGDRAWAEGMQWAFGGYMPFNRNKCICLNASFDLDFYARSFIPEGPRSSVAIVDTNGNFILRTGSYGNPDSRGPEVRFGYMRFVAVTDQRLYVADIVNRRIVSVNLKYEKEAEAGLK